MQKATTILVILAITGSLVCTIYAYLFSNSKKSEQHQAQALATITSVYPTHVTRYGLKIARYDILFKDNKDKEHIKYRCELGNGYKKGDTIKIIYDPNDSNSAIKALESKVYE